MTQQPGIGHADASVPNPDYAQATTTPIADQQAIRVAARQLQRRPDRAAERRRERHLLRVAALQAGAITPTQLQQNIGAAAQQLAGIVQQIVAAGATHVFVSNVPDIGGTPLALQSGSQTTLTQLSMLFNGTLAATLQALKVDTTKYVLLDTFTWQDGILANYKANGFAVSNTDTACNLKAMVRRHAVWRRERNRIRLVAVLLAADLHGRERGSNLHVRRHGPPDDAPACAVRAVRAVEDRGLGRRQVLPATRKRPTGSHRSGVFIREPRRVSVARFERGRPRGRGDR